MRKILQKKNITKAPIKIYKNISGLKDKKGKEKNSLFSNIVQYFLTKQYKVPHIMPEKHPSQKTGVFPATRFPRDEDKPFM